MADGLELKRIVDLVAQTDIDEGVYTIIDSVSGAVKKYPLGSFICSVAPIFDTTAAYAAGAYCNYNGQLYQFDDAHAAGGWIGTDATAVTLSDILSENGEDITDLQSDVSTLQTDVETLEDQINALFVTDTASGPIASFPDGADGIPVKDMTVQIEPVQDLHGYENPWPAGGGKNKLNVSLPIVLSEAGNIGNTPCVLPPGTYTFTSKTSVSAAYNLQVYDSNGTRIAEVASATASADNLSATFTISAESSYIRCYCGQLTGGQETQELTPNSDIHSLWDHLSSTSAFFHGQIEMMAKI